MVSLFFGSLSFTSLWPGLQLQTCSQYFIHQASCIQRYVFEVHQTPEVVYGKCESDSHADTIAAGANCVVLNYTGKGCDVSPYRDDYEAVKNAPIVNAATAWQSHQTGQTYILVFNEALWMGDSMDNTLFNPNQLRHYGTKVLCIHSRVIFRGYLSEDLVSEDDNRRKLRGCVDCTRLKLRTRYIFY